jgi:hypothetical protein
MVGLACHTKLDIFRTMRSRKAHARKRGHPLATKKTKKPRREPAIQPQKTEGADNPRPGKLELEFRRSLGRHNLHLSMLEISAKTFADTLSKQPREACFIRDCDKKLGLFSKQHRSKRAFFTLLSTAYAADEFLGPTGTSP